MEGTEALHLQVLLKAFHLPAKGVAFHPCLQHPQTGLLGVAHDLLGQPDGPGAGAEEGQGTLFHPLAHLVLDSVFPGQLADGGGLPARHDEGLEPLQVLLLPHLLCLYPQALKRLLVLAEIPL